MYGSEVPRIAWSLLFKLVYNNMSGQRPPITELAAATCGIKLIKIDKKIYYVKLTVH